MDTYYQYPIRTKYRSEQQQEWDCFWSHATTLSRNKETKLKPQKEKESRVAIKRWVSLYYKRWNSIVKYNEWKFAPVPSGAWDRVGRWGMSDAGDHIYDHNCYGKHGDPLADGWVLENSIPDIQRTGNKTKSTEEDDCEEQNNIPRWPIEVDECEARDYGPILQILNVPEKVGNCHLLLSDGDYYILGKIHPPLEKLRTNSVVELKEYRMDYNPVPIVRILSMEIWNDLITWKIRAPKLITEYQIGDFKNT